MILYHLTLREHLGSVVDHGIRVKYAHGDRRVWLCEYPEIHHVLWHLANHHNRHVSEFCMVRVTGLRSWELRRSGQQGRWFTRQDVLPSQLSVGLEIPQCLDRREGATHRLVPVQLTGKEGADV